MVTIAYPHGSTDEHVVDAVVKAGFRAGFTIVSEAVGSRSDRLRMGRFSPWRSSAGNLAVGIAMGLYGAARQGGAARPEAASL